MRPPAGDDRRHATLSRLLAISASVAALAIAFQGLWIAVPRLDDSRAFSSALSPELRDDPVADLYGLGEPRWVGLRRAVGDGDHYAVVADGDGQHEVRNYAAYTLLPAIQVTDPADADVVVYYAVPPPATGCVPVGKDVCVVRRTE